MGVIDLENFDKLPPEMQEQFAELLKQHPHLDSKLKSPAHELNTPTKLAEADDENQIDYSNMSLDDIPQPQTTRPKTPTLRFQREYDEEAEAEKVEAEVKKTQQQKKEAPQPQPEYVANFSPVGKQHPVLKKLRASLGMGVYQKPFLAEVGGLVYEMLPLSRDTMTQAVTLAATNSLNDTEFRANQDVAIIAFSVQKIDQVPMVEVFSIADHDIEAKGTKIPLTMLQRKEKAANLFFHELKDSPPELADALISYYQQEFPPKSLLGENKITAYCPEANCTYQRILEENEDGYCPFHGAQLAKESELPNPF